MVGPRVMLGLRRLHALEKFIGAENVPIAYAVCAAMGCRPHWNPGAEVLYLHSPLKGRRILLGVDPGVLNSPVEELIAKFTEELGHRVCSAGGTVNRIWSVTRGLVTEEPDADVLVQLQPRLTMVDELDLRATHSFNRCVESRALAGLVVRSILRRMDCVRAGVHFLWNSLINPETYRVLNWPQVPSIAVEWFVGERTEQDKLTESLGEGLQECLEATFMSKDGPIVDFRFQEREFERAMAAFKLQRESPSKARSVEELESKDVAEEEPEEKQSARQKRHTRQYTSGTWVSSRDKHREMPRPKIKRLSPEEEQRGRSLARRLRGG